MVQMTTNLLTRVTFERDEGQDYPVGTRVTAHAMECALVRNDPEMAGGVGRLPPRARVAFASSADNGRDNGFHAF